MKVAIGTSFLAATAAVILPASATALLFDRDRVINPSIPALIITTPSSDNVGGHIVGGQDAAPGEFPYYATPTGENGVCGGALIATNIILTAAHCAYICINSYLTSKESSPDGCVTILLLVR
jgi:hypothetical protein